MKAKNGDKIKLIENVSYGTVYGLVSISKGEVLTVKHRTDSDDGIIAEETVNLSRQLGEKEVPIIVWDNQYVSNDVP